MSGRALGPFWIDEFTAGYLEDILWDELESLKEHLHERRDRADRLGWGSMSLRVQGIHGLWCSVRASRLALGEPTPKEAEALLRDEEQRARQMPRSKANAAQWTVQQLRYRRPKAKR